MGVMACKKSASGEISTLWRKREYSSTNQPNSPYLCLYQIIIKIFQNIKKLWSAEDGRTDARRMAISPEPIQSGDKTQQQNVFDKFNILHIVSADILICFSYFF